MSRISLTGGFTPMPEGTYVLKITSAEYKEEFGKIKLVLQNVDGKKHFENFAIVNKDGEVVEGACNAFSALAKTALKDQTATDVDVEELKGCYVKGEISYREYETKDGTTKKTTQKEPGTWWQEVTDEEIADFEAHFKGNTVKPTTTEKPAFDLNSILGRK